MSSSPPPTRLPGSVLFACTMNTVRSPMAAALFKRLSGGRVYVASIGVERGAPDGFAAAAMQEIGLDISAHESHSVDELQDTSFDLIVALSEPAYRAAQDLARTAAIDVEFWDMPDPAELSTGGAREARLAGYRALRLALEERIAKRFGLERAG